MKNRKLTDVEARSGYTKDFSFNPNWKEQKAICGYEHCIELMPLEEDRIDKSCHIFGHNCPGGKEMAQKCRVTFDSIPDNRFVKDDKEVK